MLFTATPILVFAQTFADVLTRVGTLVSDLVPVVGLIISAIFVWGVFVFVTNAANETKRKQGITIMTYSLIGVVLVVSVWGLVNLVIDVFGITGEQPPIPQIRLP